MFFWQINSRKGKLKVGYRNLNVTRDSLLLRAGESLIGHEFHQWELSDLNYSESYLDQYPQILNTKPLWKVDGWKVQQGDEGWGNQLFHASWIHLHWVNLLEFQIRLKSIFLKKLS